MNSETAFCAIRLSAGATQKVSSIDMDLHMSYQTTFQMEFFATFITLESLFNGVVDGHSMQLQSVALK
jgi:hypothetical protein